MIYFLLIILISKMIKKKYGVHFCEIFQHIDIEIYKVNDARTVITYYTDSYSVRNMRISLSFNESHIEKIFKLFSLYYDEKIVESKKEEPTEEVSKILCFMVLDIIKCIEKFLDDKSIGEKKIYDYAKWYNTCYHDVTYYSHLATYSKFITYQACTNILNNKLYKQYEVLEFDVVEF